jgi:hypothetical protein
VSKLFSSDNEKFLQIDRTESELNKFICKNWKDLFPQHYTFIHEEFTLEGNVRSSGDKSGRIDILGFNQKTEEFIIFELKKDYDKNITGQAFDYRNYIRNNFPDIYMRTTDTYGIKLPEYRKLKSKNQNPEIILIAKKFGKVQINDAIDNAKENNIIITLIKYYWFENNFIFIDYVNNDPDDSKIEIADTQNREINNIKNINSSEKEAQDKIANFFRELPKNKTAFDYFFNFLKSDEKVNLKGLKFNKYSIRIEFNNTTLSVGIQSKVVLLVLTNIDVRALSKDVADRCEEGNKKGCHYGTERFKVYCHDEDEVKKFYIYIKDKDFQPLSSCEGCTGELCRNLKDRLLTS